MIKSFLKCYGAPLAGIFVLCIFCYSNALGHTFILDDYEILQDQIVPKALDFSYFTSAVNGFYRPISIIFIKLTSLIVGFNPTGYHVVNLILFFLMCALFLFIGDMLFIVGKSNTSDSLYNHQARSIPFLAACLYCVHPINNMIVNYITASSLAICIINVQLSYLFFLAFLNKRNKFIFFLSMFFYLCSLFSHEMACILLVYLFMTVFYLKKDRWIKSLFLMLPYLIGFVFFMIVRNHYNLRGTPGLFNLPISFGMYLATLSQLYGWYFSKLFFPVQLLFIWDVPIQPGHLLGRSLWLLLLGGASSGLYFILIKLKKRVEVFSLTLFLVGFLPSVIAAFTYTSLLKTGFLEPHWFYFSSIGFFVLIASGLASITKSWNSRLKLLLYCGIIAILALMTRHSNLVWKDEETYCQYWISLNPYNGTPFHGLERAQGMKQMNIPEEAGGKNRNLEREFLSQEQISPKPSFSPYTAR